MAITVRELMVTLGFEANQRQLNNAESGLKKLEKAAKVVGAIFATGALAKGFNDMIGLASDAAEVANKFGAVFEDAGDKTQKALDDIAKRTGASGIQLQEFSSQIGAIVKPALGSANAASDIASGISELALDIASFNNLEPEVALEKLRAGLIGSVEPLDSVGVNLRKSNIDLDRFAAQLGKTASQLTQGELMQARYNAIVKQLTAQGSLGDAARTSQDLANAQRNLRGRLKEAGALLGGFFLKSAKESTNALLGLVTRVMDWIKANRELIQQGVDKTLKAISRVAEALVDVVRLAVEGWRMFTEALGESGAQMANVALALVVLIGLLGLPTVLLLAIGAAIFLVIEDLKVMGEGGESVIGTLIDGFKGLVEELGSLPAAIVEFLSTAFDYWADFFGDMFGVSEETIEGIKGAFAALASFIADTLGAAFGIAKDLGGSVMKLFSGDFKGALKGVENAVSRAGGVLFDLADKTQAGELFGGEAQRMVAAGIAAEQATATARPGTAAVAAGAQSAQVTTNATINVTGGPGQSAEAIGRGAMDRASELRAKDERRAASFAFNPGAA